MTNSQHNMEFVNVLGSLNLDWNQLPYNLLSVYVSNYLYSLINGLRSKSFGIDTIHRFSLNLQDAYKKYFETSKVKLFIDSGGYSIIVGDVHPNQITKFLYCYNYFLENYCPSSCDYLFSLDIPIFLKFPRYNKVSILYNANKKSLKSSLNIVDKKDLYDKFILVWQFKILKQYQIWNTIYNELPSEQVEKIKNYALGGMVGLRRITGIKFSPFISMTYKLLHILDKNEIENGRIHFLGIYGKHDRFLGNFMSRLFNCVYNVPVILSYDTINYHVSGVKRSGSNISIYDKTFNNVISINELTDDDILSLCGKCEKIKEQLSKHIDYFRKTGRCIDTTTIATLNVAYERITDFIIQKIIDDENLVNKFVECKNFNKFKNVVKSCLSKYKHSFIANFISKILLNFQYLYVFHDWWIKSRNEDDLEKLNEKFIKFINFPFDID